jgi:hypothetical protein
VFAGLGLQKEVMLEGRFPGSHGQDYVSRYSLVLGKESATLTRHREVLWWMSGAALLQKGTKLANFHLEFK